jgi:predicted aminopeptidase
MGIQIRDAGAIAKKWTTRASAAAPDYTSGVQNTTADQAALAAAAEPLWQQSVAEAAANGSYGKGVRKAGTEKWRTGATTKGAQRYSGGVNAGQANYQAGVAPFLQTLSNLSLPPRQVKGNNMARVQMVVDALRKQKLQGA